ncbi:MAG: metal-sensitive transcriptional regulator [Propionibacterium sp.]
MSVPPIHDERSALITRLHRIEGQIHAIGRMIEQDAYCIDVLTQISAASGALQSVALIVLEDHLRHCVAEAATGGGPVSDAKLQEASQAIARLVRS